MCYIQLMFSKESFFILKLGLKQTLIISIPLLLQIVIWAWAQYHCGISGDEVCGFGEYFLSLFLVIASLILYFVTSVKIISELKKKNIVHRVKIVSLGGVTALIIGMMLSSFISITTQQFPVDFSFIYPVILLPILYFIYGNLFNKILAK